MCEPVTFSRFIRDRRLGQGLTRTAVARAAGLSEAAICGYELYGSSPRLVHVPGLARALGCTSYDLVDVVATEERAGGDIVTA